MASAPRDLELVRLDYEQTTQLVRALTDIRFKLLAFVPTIAGAAVAFLSDPESASALLAVGLLGLVATLGIFLYELRNSQLMDAGVRRAEVLEARLGIGSVRDETGVGGVFSERPDRSLPVVGRASVWHDRGVAFVYAAALAGWTYLAAWGALAVIGLSGARNGGAIAGGVAALAVLYETGRLAGAAGRAEARA